MQKALVELPVFQAKQPPNIAIEKLLAIEYDKKLQALNGDNRGDVWDKALPALVAGYRKDLDEYNARVVETVEHGNRETLSIDEHFVPRRRVADEKTGMGTLFGIAGTQAVPGDNQNRARRGL
jgi:hypothetical protein